VTRDVSAEIITLLSETSLAPFFALEMQFDSGVVRAWTGRGEIVYDGETWTGVGSFLNISEITETAEISASGASVTLSGVPSDMLSLALQEAYQNRIARVFLGFHLPDRDNLYEVDGTEATFVIDIARNVFATRDLTLDDYAVGGTEPSLVVDFSNSVFLVTEDGAVPDDNVDMIEVFTGRMDQMNIDEGAETATIELTIESRMIDLERERVYRYTAEDQKSRYSTDLAFDFVNDLQTAQLTLGRA
jgi:hypothetical protein